MKNFRFPNLRHEELLREAGIHRQVKASRATGKRRADWSPALAWKLRRHTGVLLKILRTLKNVG
jgi:hypothetical protein